MRGIAIGNGLARKNADVEYLIVNSSDFGFLCDRSGFMHVEIPIEELHKLSPDNYKLSVLYNVIVDYSPDVLIVDLLWFPLQGFIRELTCKKVLLLRYVDNSFFSIKHAFPALEFIPSYYDDIIAIEPVPYPFKSFTVNPIIIRNKNEILSRHDALRSIGCERGKPLCLVSINGEPGEFEKVKLQYEYLENEGFELVYSTNYNPNSLFPAVDHFNAFDMVVCSAGYNSFWETVYFDMQAILVPEIRAFGDQRWRVGNCTTHSFEENGADQLVDYIMKYDS